MFFKKGLIGVILMISNQSIILGKYNETVQPGNAYITMTKVKKYLLQQGL